MFSTWLLSLSLSLLNLRIATLSHTLSFSPLSKIVTQNVVLSAQKCDQSAPSILFLYSIYSFNSQSLISQSRSVPSSLCYTIWSSILCPRNATLSHSLCLSFTKNALKLKALVHGSIGRRYSLSRV